MRTTKSLPRSRDSRKLRRQVSEPATKQDLDEAMGVLHGEIEATAAELRGEMTGMEARLRGEMTGMEARLRGEMDQIRGDMKAMKAELLLEIGSAISRATNVMTEEFRRQFSVLDDKYGDLRPRHDQLRADLDTHTTDLSLHVRRSAAPAKRTRRSPSR